MRASYGLRRLRVSSRIQQAAHSWATHLLRSDSFYHARLASGTAENLAWGTCGWITPAKVVRMWLNSSGHRANLLRRGMRYIGAGVRSGSWRGHRCVRMSVVRFR